MFENITRSTISAKAKEATKTGDKTDTQTRLTQADHNGQDAKAHLAPPQPQAVQQPQAVPLHQVALLQQAAPPQHAVPTQQQAHDHAGNVIFIPPVAISQHTATILPGVISTVDTGLTSTCVDTCITSTITSSHQTTPQPIKSITVPNWYYVNQTITKNHHRVI